LRLRVLYGGRKELKKKKKKKKKPATFHAAVLRLPIVVSV
jgi:hypothetical protein